ncbi:MAG: S8 family serine peptidase [Nitrososphaerales archaeon]
MIHKLWQKCLVALLAFALLINFASSLASSNYVEVIVEFKTFDETSIDSNLIYLNELGYDFEVIDELRNAMNGAVIIIESDQVEKLKQEDTVSNVYTEKFLKTNLEKSLKLISADNISSYKDSFGKELTGEGFKVAVVDTGIDYTHQDLFGFGEEGKVVYGYDFLERDNEPMDTDGHGTLVAGIIAADGKLKGVSPKAELVAYRIASEGSYVSTNDMIRALDRAVDDGVDVVNISLGLDYVSEEIDKAVENLVKKGVVVIAAAGNNGQTSKTIGSPAAAASAISVGASTSLASTLKIDDPNSRYNVTSMVGSVVADEPIKSKLVYAKFAREKDVENMDLKGAIVLAERGGALTEIDGKQQMELVYFSDKEANVARSGAAALIVYNNMPGIFYGQLTHEKAAVYYKPRIPVVSISREEGLMIKEIIDSKEVNAELRVFYNPDTVAPFSSRGPVSPFYVKPDLVAPGAFINSTTIENSYKLTSGTSFAAPLVAGAAVLLLQKNPELKPDEVVSILATTADPLNDAYGFPYPFEVAGAGRLNVAAALQSNVIAIPHYSLMHISSTSKENSKTIELRSVQGELRDLNVSMSWHNKPVSLNAYIENVNATNANLIIDAMLSADLIGMYEGRVYLESDRSRITIPVIVHVNEATVSASNKDGRIWLSIYVPEHWTFAKVKITNPENRRSQSVTLTPLSNLSSVPARSVGEHWIEADVVTELGDVKGFSVLYVDDTSGDTVFTDYLTIYGIPVKETFMIATFLGTAVAVAFAWARKNASRAETIPSQP